MNPIAALRRKLEQDTGGVAVFGLVVLSLLYFFDEFDTAAFGTLAPDIEKSFHLTDQRFVGLVVVNVSLVLLLAIPVGYLADRIRRTPLVILSGILAGACSLATGMVGTVALLTMVRFGNGLGLLANQGIHNSLLADYYPPESRAAVYGDHANALQIGAIVGPALAGVVATLFSWQVAFMVLIVPILAVTLLATRLKEPRRGGTDDPESALEAEAEAPVPFKEATRTLWAVKTVRRQYWSSLVLGAGLLPLAGYLPLYYDRVYHLGPAWRGVIGAASAAATFVGIRWSGRVTPGWFAKGMGEPLKKAGLALAAVGVGITVVAASPFLVVSVGLGLLTSFAFGVFTPPYYAVQSLVSPARVRTLSFSFGSLFLVGGVVGLFYVAGLSTISDDYGIRWGIFILGPYWVVAGAILASASRFVAADVEAAMKTLSSTAALRRQRLSAGDRSLLLCTGVDVAYDAVKVLFSVDLEVKEGEIIALLGTNGAGKSTLLKAISGLVDPSGGAIFFDGNDVTHADPKRSAELGIVQMPGGRSVFPTLTVNECLRLAGWMYKRTDPDHVKQTTETVLGYFPVLRERGDQLAGNLSGGEQQMLGLGMAFIAKPKLLMIDELTLGLAPTIVSTLMDIVRAIHAQGTTIIIVEQSVNVALTLAHRAVFMEKGEVRFSGPTADLLGRDDILRSVFLEGAASHPGTDGPKKVTAGKAKGAAPADSTVTVGGLRTREMQPPADAPVLLELEGVVKRFGGIKAVDSVDFQVREGEILGLIGPNGAGKTTVFDLISGFLVPDAGRITFAGEDVTQWSPDRRARAGLGRSFQDARLFASLSVAENIAVALERHLEVRDPLAEALGLPEVAESEIDVAWRVHELIDLLGLDAFRNKFVSELSTGSRRIVDLAMAIAHEPSVLILDEPSSGIAQRETEALGPLLLRIQREVG
ncbi:MAG: branched-chain amino acid transport system ATP-binding protein livF, partial [Actinomycetota bacterium]|nr:branched-chain amino acid transport system ATP-binding protein livF [Actinomycetota bacterium]